MQYSIIKEIKSPAKVNKWLYLQDLIFIVAYFGISYAFSTLIYSTLVIPYLIYSAIMGLILTAPSMYNPKRRNWESILLLLRRDTIIYKPLQNLTQCRSLEEAWEKL